MTGLENRYDVAVIGGGLTGLTAAVYLARSGKSVVLIEKDSGLGGHARTVRMNGADLQSGRVPRGGSSRHRADGQLLAGKTFKYTSEGPVGLIYCRWNRTCQKSGCWLLGKLKLPHAGFTLRRVEQRTDV